jgi:hypothetical protein
LKYSAGEEYRRSVGPMVWEMKKYYTVLRRIGISYLQEIEGRLIVMVISCVETAF